MPFRRQVPWAWLVIPLILCHPLWAQIVESDGQGTKNATCTVAGSWSFARICGARAYARVFAGTVLSVTDIPGFNKRLELVTDVSFSGDNPGKVSAVVNQACMPPTLPPFRTGDKWLFYLQPGKNADVFTLPFNGPSKPIAQAQTDIELLSRVARLTNLGIVTGQVRRAIPKGQTWDAVPVPGRPVIANRKSDGAEFSVLSDKSGHFELELVPGSYHVTANVEPKSPLSEGDILIRAGDCLEIGFLLNAVVSTEPHWDLILPPELPDHISDQP
jgi:hypothetical protein